MSLKEKFQELKKSHPFVLLFLFIYLGFLIIYISIFQLFYADYSKPMPLNEIGDFLAGVFSPLAFLFLYLGYIQNNESIRLQSKELKASTDALTLQVAEMKESVEQQKIMVQIQNNEIEAKHFSVQPHLEFKVLHVNSSDEQRDVRNNIGQVEDIEIESVVILTLKISNSGGTARHLRIFDKAINSPVYYTPELANNNNQVETIYLSEISLDEFYKKNNVKITYDIEYQNIFGRFFNFSVQCSIYPDIDHGDHYFGTITKIL